MIRVLVPSLIVVALLAAVHAHAGPPSRWGGDGSFSPSSTASPAEEEAVPSLIPVQTPGGTVLAPAPSKAAPRASQPWPRASAPSSVNVPPPRAVHSGRSDLPPGWEQPAALPPGAIRLEEVQGRPVTRTSTPAAPAVPAPITESDVGAEGWIQETPKKLPSRWGQ